MSQTTITAYYYVDGVLTDATSATLSDLTGTYGVRRTDCPDGDAVVVDGTAMAKVATGTYQYSFDDPAYDLTYEYAIEFLYGGIVTRFSGLIDGTPTPTAAAGSILALLQKLPYIKTADGEYVETLIDLAQKQVAAYCELAEYPSLWAGVASGRAGASTDLSALGNNGFQISVDGSLWQSGELTLANCTTGALTAAELQTQIRAISPSDARLAWLFEGVVVDFDSTSVNYTVTSPSWGEASNVHFGVFDMDGNVDVAQALGMSPRFGGEDVSGSANDSKLDGLVAALVSDYYQASKIASSSYTTTAAQVSLSDKVFQDIWNGSRARFLPFRRLR